MKNITEKITNPKVKAAVDALQAGNLADWLACFSDNAKLFDDGKAMNLKSFSKDALGHEKFVSIDKVENNSMDIYGQFETEKWGSFKTYFKFHLGANGKFERLDIGQANY
ncbi:hypothetical protein [Fluviispira vulneris]|uniref:hypothetical protein n=1 Tax=Fluviispira vulneris TaxID=2763012 RepID=UPI0016492AEB|nr:hypothetical protein [Fluviispira vulneris]